MPLREDLLNPIPGENPGGADLRYDPIYDKIKEFRRQDDDLNQGAWQHERKVADWPQVIKLTQDALATKSKDLQLAAWLTEALLRKEGFGGLLDGLTCCKEIIERFWDHCYPAVEDGDVELRAAPLEWVGSRFEEPIKSVLLNRAGHTWYQHKESRAIGYEDQAKDANAKKAREKLLKEGKLAPEDFDKAFGETPKLFYASAEKNLDACLATLNGLSELCAEKFGESAPGFSKLTSVLTEVRHTVHQFLEKKRELEPDPVEASPEEQAGAAVDGGPAGDGTAPAAGATVVAISLEASTEPEDRRAMIEQVAMAAAFFRKKDPKSPAPYLMMRGLRWGELRSGGDLNPRLLEAPPTEVRRQVKTLALAEKWKDLIEVGENLMAFPYSRAWLDLQRVEVDACVALGTDYDAIAKAIRSELRAVIRDVPQLLQATLMDDTPAANAETQKWLKELAGEPEAAPSASNGPGPVNEDRASEGWRRKFVDPFALAQAAMRGGEPLKALEIMKDEIGRQRSGRGRFLRRLQLVQLCAGSGKEAIAQPILEDLIAAVDAHKIEEWEDREVVAEALALIMTASKRVSGDAKEKQKYFERICRLDPVRALTTT